MEGEDFLGPLVEAAGVAAVLAVCGCSELQTAALVGEGFATIADFLVIQPKDVAGMCTNLARLPVNRGGSKIGTVIMKKIEALVLWCHDHEREGQDLDANAFDDVTLIEYVKKCQLDEARDQTSPEPPKDFKVLKWVTWICKFETFFWQIKGKNQVPLIYVIRKDRDPDLAFTRLLTLAMLFRHDNARVWNELQSIEGIRAGHAQAVSDGSFKDSYGTAAGVIAAGEDDDDMLYFVTSVPGSLQDQSSYRSKLAGILGTLHILEALCLMYKIRAGSVTIALDGKEAMHQASYLNKESPLQAGQNSFDLISAIRTTCELLPITIQWKWVEGHQVEKGKRLDWWGKKNHS